MFIFYSVTINLSSWCRPNSPQTWIFLGQNLFWSKVFGHPSICYKKWIPYAWSNCKWLYWLLANIFKFCVKKWLDWHQFCLSLGKPPRFGCFRAFLRSDTIWFPATLRYWLIWLWGFPASLPLSMHPYTTCYDIIVVF